MSCKNVINNFTSKIKNLKEELIRLRRDFHQYPELGFQEKRTASIIAKYLTDLGLRVQTGIAETGIMALLSGKGPGKTLMLRADMDALPIQEEGQTTYRSLHDGVMHACGHDGHMAILLGVAKILTICRDSFVGQIKFVFQPGEEGCAGAKHMIDHGILTKPRVNAAFALHLITHLPVGVVGVRSKHFMASMDSFTIKLIGKTGHAAMPEGGVDSILMSSQVITTLQSLVSREVSPLAPLVIHIGTVHGGRAFNIVADEVVLKGTVRTLDETIQKSIPTRMERVVKGITAAFRGTYELDYRFNYPPVINDEELTKVVRCVAGRLVGYEKIIEVQPTLMSDDMSFFLMNVPGCYFFLGAGNVKRGLDRPHHDSRFDFDEDALLTGTELTAHLALKYLNADFD